MSRTVKLLVDLTVSDDAPIDPSGRYAGAKGADCAWEFQEALHEVNELLPSWIETIDGVEAEVVS